MESKRPSRKPSSCYSQEIIQDCLRILRSGDVEELFAIIPRIGVIRDPSFNEHLHALLMDKDIKKREFAAYAMGATASREFLETLKSAFAEAERMQGFGARELQIAIIEAIGSIGEDAAEEFFLPVLYNLAEAGKGKKKLAASIVESLGAIAQQGGERCIMALIELTSHSDPEIGSQAISELSVAYWHRPNEISDSTFLRLCDLAQNRHPAIAESALAALQSLADVGCQAAERYFSTKNRR